MTPLDRSFFSTSSPFPPGMWRSSPEPPSRCLGRFPRRACTVQSKSPILLFSRHSTSAAPFLMLGTPPRFFFSYPPYFHLFPSQLTSYFFFFFTPMLTSRSAAFMVGQPGKRIIQGHTGSLDLSSPLPCSLFLLFFAVPDSRFFSPQPAPFPLFFSFGGFFSLARTRGRGFEVLEAT